MLVRYRKGLSRDDRSFKLTALAVEGFGRLGGEGYEFIGELTTHEAGGGDGGYMTPKRETWVLFMAQQASTSRQHG